MKIMLRVFLALLLVGSAQAQNGLDISSRSAAGLSNLAGSDCTFTLTGLNNCPIGVTTPAAGTFTTVKAADAGSFRFTTDTFITRYAAKQLMISGDGVGATTNAGVILGYLGASGLSAIWSSGVVPDTSNYGIALQDSGRVYLNAGAGTPLDFQIGGATKASLSASTGAGISITAGTATTDVNALSMTQTFNGGGVTFTGIKSTTTWTAAAAGSKLMDIIQDAASAFSVIGVASGLNGVSLQVGATTVGPTLSAQGETNVPITLTSKGTGTLTLNATGSGSLTFGSGIVTPAASGVRFLCISTAGVVASQSTACVGT